MTVRTALAGSSAPHTSRSQAFMTWDSWPGYGKPATACLAMRPSPSSMRNRSCYQHAGLIATTHLTAGSWKCQTPIPLESRYADLKRRLSIFRALIFDSSVDAGTPSRPAAPNGPATRPLLSFSAASMASFSWSVSVPLGLMTGGASSVRPESHRASIESVSESHTITARSMTFCTSRMLPGQS